MTELELKKSTRIINELISRFDSLRAFAREIQEDPADVSRWKSGKSVIKVRAVIALVKLFQVKASDLNPDVFPPHVEIIFNEPKRGK